MFDNEITLNRFLVGYLKRIASDIPQDRLAERPPGNGHPPVWILGHLAWSGEFGETLCGGEMEHKDWTGIFGLGSSDDVADPGQYDRDELLEFITTGFERLCDTASHQTSQVMDESHGIAGFSKSLVRTKGQMLAHLLTSHFSFHLSQLSSWRRADGQGPLF